MIDHKADALGAHRKNHHMPFALLFMGRRGHQPALEVEQWQRLVPHDHHFLAVDHIGARQVEVENFVDVDQRERKRLIAQHHHQGRHDGQGQRHLDHDFRTATQGRLNAQRAIELGDLGFHHIHAHATPGHIGNLGFGGEARGKNQVVAIVFAQAIGCILVHQPFFHCNGAQHIGVHAFAVIGNRQQDMVAFLLGRQNYPAAARFTGCFALFGGFTPVVNRVAHQVHQRIGQGLDQILVEVGFFAHQLQADFFFQLSRQIPNQTREAAEHFLDRLHAGLHDRGLQVGSHHVKIGQRLGHRFVVAVEAQAHQTVTHQHQLADHVHDVVQPRSINPHRGLGFRSLGLVGAGSRGPGGHCTGGLGRTGYRRWSRGRGRGRNNGCNRRALDRKLALAVQLIEQCFKFVIADVIRADRLTSLVCRHNRGCAQRIGIE